jgi:hypothetical protein
MWIRDTDVKKVASLVRDPLFLAAVLCLPHTSGSYRKVVLVQTYSADLLAAALCVFRFLVSFPICYESVNGILQAIFRALKAPDPRF